MKLDNAACRVSVLSEIETAFHAFNWPDAVDRDDMDLLWSGWVEAYRVLVDKLIGTRPARESSWGRKFDSKVRTFCKRASISRSWYILACQADQPSDSFFDRWVEDRDLFIKAWEKSKRDRLTAAVTMAVKRGDIAVWKLLNGSSKNRFRPLVKTDGSILTDPVLIADELVSFHERMVKEIFSTSHDQYDPVIWENDFLLQDSPDGDLVLNITDALVIANIKKMKLTTVPDLISPVVIKLFFGSLDSVKPLADIIRAVVKTRCFPRDATNCPTDLYMEG